MPDKLIKRHEVVELIQQKKLELLNAEREKQTFLNMHGIAKSIEKLRADYDSLDVKNLEKIAQLSEDIKFDHNKYSKERLDAEIRAAKELLDNEQKNKEEKNKQLSDLSQKMDKLAETEKCLKNNFEKYNSEFLKLEDEVVKLKNKILENNQLLESHKTFTIESKGFIIPSQEDLHGILFFHRSDDHDRYRWLSRFHGLPAWPVSGGCSLNFTRGFNVSVFKKDKDGVFHNRFDADDPKYPELSLKYLEQATDSGSEEYDEEYYDIEEGDLVIMALSDEGVNRLEHESKKIIQNTFGSNQINQLGFGFSWCYVGIFGHKNTILQRPKQNQALIT